MSSILIGLLTFQAASTMAKEFDFSPRKVYGQQEFHKTVVKGPAELRQVVEAELVKDGNPYLACLMGLTKDG